MTTDRWLTRLVALTVCAMAVLVTVTACTLFFREVAVPDPLDRLVTFLLGGLVGRLTTSRGDQGPTEVVTPPGEALDVDPVRSEDPGWRTPETGHADLTTVLVALVVLLVVFALLGRL